MSSRESTPTPAFVKTAATAVATRLDTLDSFILIAKDKNAPTNEIKGRVRE
jgi:hypothetical protein